MSDCLISHKMLRHAVVSDKPGGLSVQPPPPPGKLAARLKLPFGGSCHIISVAHSLTRDILGDRNRASAVAQLSRYLFFTCHEIKNRLPRGRFLNLISQKWSSMTDEMLGCLVVCSDG